MAEGELSFDPSKKKKKKKKVALEPEEEEEKPVSVPDPSTEETSKENLEPEKTAEHDTLDFDRKKKKKKKVAKAGLDEEKTDEDAVESAAPAGSDLVDAQTDWPDFTYDELLNRVFGIMRERNPELVTGEKKKFVMKPPSVMRVGSKKTAFANFADICRLLKRTPKHVLQFLLAELGTSGSIDGNNCLIVRGRFMQKHFENVLRKYIKEYVTCHTCKSADTLMQREERLQFLQCETCGSRCSVAQIKAGFQAQTTKRAAQRAAAAAIGK